MSSSAEIIQQRIAEKPKNKLWNVHTLLRHFFIITYLVDIEKFQKVIPPHFEVEKMTTNGKSYAMVSAVTFVDKDFHFPNFLPFCKFEFPQTNYRAYVINKKTGEKCAWFFGTALGSKWVNIPKNIWKMPWFYAKYKTNFDFSDKYNSYKVTIEAPNASARIDITEDETTAFNTDDFVSQNEAVLVLTHPVTGYFFRADKTIGRYKIWHPLMDIKSAICNDAYFELFEHLGLLTKEQMQRPYSVLLTNEIEFIIDLPPQKINLS